MFSWSEFIVIYQKFFFIDLDKIYYSYTSFWYEDVTELDFSRSKYYYFQMNDLHSFYDSSSIVTFCWCVWDVVHTQTIWALKNWPLNVTSVEEFQLTHASRQLYQSTWYFLRFPKIVLELRSNILIY